MKEYGISVTDKASGSKVEVYFAPMCYADWNVYNGSVESYDTASLRYIFQKYITRAHLVSSSEVKEVTSLELCDLAPSVVKEIMDKMLTKAGFSSTESFVSLLNNLERNASTLTGAYDLFIYLHTNYDMYVGMLDKNVFERAMLISALEKITGIEVSYRFDMSLKTGADLDLVTPPAAYRPKSKGRPTSNIRENLAGKDLSEEQLEAIDSSSRSLQEELRRGQSQGKRKFFNWNEDNQDFEHFNTEPGVELDHR